MKEKIKAAKICVIRKLVRKLKDARRSSNLKPESTKFPAQIARFTSQLEYLKVNQLKVIEESVYSLTFIAESDFGSYGRISTGKS